MTDVNTALEKIYRRIERPGIAAIAATLLAFVLLFFGVLFYIVGQLIAMQNSDAIAEARSEVVELTDPSRLDRSMEGKLVHVTGEVVADGRVQDPVFGITQRAVGLERKVRYYQWRKRQDKDQKKNRIVYEKHWSDEPVDSSEFHVYGNAAYNNHILADLATETFFGTARLGAYLLPDFLKTGWPEQRPLTLRASDSELAFFQSRVLPRHRDWRSRRMVHMRGNELYLGHNPDEPEIGDMRISFFESRPGTVSLIAEVRGNTFVKYRTGGGQEFSDVASGTKNAETMLGRSWLVALISMAWLSVGLFVVTWIFLKVAMVCGKRNSRRLHNPALCLTFTAVAVSCFLFRPWSVAGYIFTIGAVAALCRIISRERSAAKAEETARSA